MTQTELQNHRARLLSIKEVAQLAGVSTRTIRRYHDMGILPPPIRLAGLSLLKWRQGDVINWIDDQADER
ncbi:MAG: MerR family regulatory protein [Candidatus Hydrogenedentes bacterium ADurb.Bin101]|nr:MAG: MerR family regulatory protein [Candidatus Hydrogenedentes bacterium ADurb.Bin101]